MHSIYINIQNILTNCSFPWFNNQQNIVMIFTLDSRMKEANWTTEGKMYCKILHLSFIPYSTQNLLCIVLKISSQSINRNIPWSNVPLSLSLGGGHAVTLGVGASAGVTAALLPRPLLIQLSYLCVYSTYVLNHPFHHCPHIPRLDCVQPVSCFYTFTQHL